MSLDVDLDADKKAQKASHVTLSLSLSHSLFGDSTLQLEIVLESYRMGIALLCCLCAGCVFAAIWKIIVFVVINYA